MFMARIKETIDSLRKAHKGLAATKRELADTLAQAKQELMEINALPHTIEDQITAWDDTVDKFDEQLRENIRNYFVNDAQVYNNQPVWKEPKSLEQMLLHFGAMRGQDGRIPVTSLVLAAGSWKNLKKICAEELNKIEAGNFGTMLMSEKVKKQEKTKLQIAELEQSLKDLSNEQ